MRVPISYQHCQQCIKKINQFRRVTHHDLYHKYSTSQNFYYTKQIDQILEEAISAVYIQYEDNNYYDNKEEYLKREYKEKQFVGKISVLTEYYKFHRNLPIWNQSQIDDIMVKYYNRVKDVDYKKIKSLLKKQKGISLTTHNSFSSFENSQLTKKSKYSTMLKQLDTSNDSQFLRDVCQQIAKAFKKVKTQNNFKGTYYSGQKKFEQFLKKQKKRKQNNLKREEQLKKQCFDIKKLNGSKKLTAKSSNIMGLKQLIYDENKEIGDERTLEMKSSLSNNKTILNEIVIREEKQRKQKNNNVYPPSNRYENLRKSNSKDQFVCDLVRDKLKNIKYHQHSNVPNENIRITNQILKPMQKLQKKQKIYGELVKKSSTKQLANKLKYRSNSHHNLPTAATILSKDISKKQLLSTATKMNRSSSKKSIPLFLAKKSVIEHEILKLSKEQFQSCHQGFQKRLKKKSVEKLGFGSNQKKYSTMKVVGETGKGFVKKRNSAVENILEKKLQVYRKKNYQHGG